MLPIIVAGSRPAAAVLAQKRPLSPEFSAGALAVFIPWRVVSDITRRRALSPTFPAGAIAVFIPWRVVAENPARRISTCRLTRTRRLYAADAADRPLVVAPAAPRPSTRYS